MSFKLIQFVYTMINALEMMIFIRVLLSWIKLNRSNGIISAFYDFTDVLLYPASWILYKLNLNRGMIDFSPFLTIILLGLIERILIPLLV